MFSATFSDQVQESAQEFLDTSYLFLTVGTVGVGMVGGICGDIDIGNYEIMILFPSTELLSLYFLPDI